MNSKMTTNSQLSRTELKQNKDKLSKQNRKRNHRNGDHMEGYQWGRGWGKRGKGTGNKTHKQQVQNRQGQAKNSIGNIEAKELVRTTHGHALTGGRCGAEGAGQRGVKEGKWDNCNSIINKNILK